MYLPVGAYSTVISSVTAVKPDVLRVSITGYNGATSIATCNDLLIEYHSDWTLADNFEGELLDTTGNCTIAPGNSAAQAAVLEVKHTNTDLRTGRAIMILIVASYLCACTVHTLCVCMHTRARTRACAHVCPYPTTPS